VVRTGIANAGARIARAFHVDHVVPEAGDRAAVRALDSALSREQPRPFYELMREEQRKVIREVPLDSS